MILNDLYMKALKSINGFTSSEIYVLYSFLNVYEQKKMKYLVERELLKQYPSLKEIKKILKTLKTGTKNMNELSKIDEDTLNNEFYYTSYKSGMLGVLYHFRNSIAHGNISKDNGNVKIEDFEAQKKNPQYTAKGKMTYSILKKIVDVVNGVQ